MGIVMQLVSLMGWRGVAAGLVGAALVSAPAYHFGRIVERAAAVERTERLIGERERNRMRVEREKIERALVARRAASGVRDAGERGQRLPDDAYIRD